MNARDDGNRHGGAMPYRSRHGMIFGVCRGLAEHFDLSVFGVRLAFLVLAVATGFGPVVAAYLLSAILMRMEPALPPGNDAEEEFYNSFTTSRFMALQRLKRSCDQMERRIQRLESVVTSRDFNWERQFRNAAERD